MINEFKLQSEVKDNCLILETFGYINNVGGQKIIDEFKEHNKNGINKNCKLHWHFIYYRDY